jgi:hypothetical protein
MVNCYLWRPVRGRRGPEALGSILVVGLRARKARLALRIERAAPKSLISGLKSLHLGLVGPYLQPEGLALGQEGRIGGLWVFGGSGG